MMECFCGKFLHSSELSAHIRKKHLNSEFSFNCDICHYGSYSESHFVDHCVTLGHRPKLEKDSKVNFCF